MKPGVAQGCPEYGGVVTDPAAQPTIKVLLVEDDERLAQLTARYLESHGVVVTVARDGLEGQAEALRRQYDCLVLDLMLPGRDGIEVTRELRARTDVPITRQPMNLGDLTARAIDVFTTRHPTRKLEPTTAGGDRAIECDPVLLRRALDNLLDNAAKYSEPESPVTLAVVPNGSCVAFEITDRGIGMSAEELTRAFTPFWRADGSRTRKTGGVGLGLALARRIARVHGGDLTLTSQPGQGTTARLEVPLRDRAA